jgi:hypothetical protein
MKGGHPRNIGPMLDSLRCGARTRAGTPCRSPAVRGGMRCRMHGGGAASGALPGNTNALSHGLHTRDAVEERRQVQDLMRRSRRLLKEIE